MLLTVLTVLEINKTFGSKYNFEPAKIKPEHGFARI